MCSSLVDARVAGSRVAPPAQAGGSPSKSSGEPPDEKCAKIARIEAEEPSLDAQGFLAHYSEDAFSGGGCLQIGGPGSYSMKRYSIYQKNKIVKLVQR